MTETAYAARPIRAADESKGLELSIVVPTFNERANVAEFVRRLESALTSIAWEVIFVDDDSPDGTADEIRKIARVDPRVRCLLRIGRRGLASACVEGMLASASDFVAVMDADMQHDESVLPRMLERMRTGGTDIVVGSRYVSDGGIGNWDEKRAFASKFATRIGHLIVPSELRDPMSGFFVIRREIVLESVDRLSAVGFKILLDLFASAGRPLRFAEIGYQFRTRFAGESKLDEQVAYEYLLLVVDKLIGRYLPVRFVSFSIIGGIGVAVHMTVLFMLFRLGTMDFVSAQATAAVVAMVFNYSINNVLTYRDRRRRGVKWLSGLVSFIAVCSVGAIANVGIANYLFSRDGGWFIAALAGILVGAVWNYAVTSLYTWGKEPKKRARKVS